MDIKLHVNSLSPSLPLSLLKNQLQRHTFFDPLSPSLSLSLVPISLHSNRQCGHPSMTAMSPNDIHELVNTRE